VNALSQAGLVFFMFLVGLSLHPGELREHGRAAVLTSHASIVWPFCLGAALALLLYPGVSNQQVGFTNFALFMGCAMSITAFPVLARILSERNLLHSRMGTISIACAAVDDITGWCILGSITALIRSQRVPSAFMLAGAGAYVLLMLLVVRRLLRRFEELFRKNGRLSEGAFSLIVVLALASALATEYLGLHLVFGAFLFGAVMPKSRDFTEALFNRMESITVVVLLPLFFAWSGLRTDIGVVHGDMWLYTLLVIVTAIAGKLGASMLAARMTGVPWRDAASLGILMNTRGLMELIALNIGLDSGVISPAVFTIMVLMALVTTFMTSPLLDVVYPARLVVVQPETPPAKYVA
jgi:Kef-type K+ transport system membrane component KefB